MSESEVCITVRIAMIRDGTHGISLSAPDKVLGEWQDSGAVMLKMAGGNLVSICGENGVDRYKLSIPGTVLSSELVSETEAVVTIRM